MSDKPVARFLIKINRILHFFMEITENRYMRQSLPVNNSIKIWREMNKELFTTEAQRTRGFTLLTAPAALLTIQGFFSVFSVPLW